MAINDDIIAFLREQPIGADGAAIAERFLKFKNFGSAVADTAVSAILSKDSRAYREDNGQWMARPASFEQSDDADIFNIPWVSVYLLTDTVEKSIAHISIWSPIHSASPVFGAWLKNPALLSQDDSSILSDPRDEPFDELCAAAVMERVARELVGKVPIFFSQRHYSIFAAATRNQGATLDDYYLMNQLFRAVKIPECCPLTLENAAAALLGGFSTAESAYRQGEQFCRITASLLERMKPAGIENRKRLDAAMRDDAYDFSGKEISEKTISELPYMAGVYGFKDKLGAYIYIGKAINLRRRIERYFRFNNESPDKLKKLRKLAHALTVHRCGSELEALIFEYRLIKKHKPLLNSQQAVSERKGSYKALPDSVIILPCAQEGFYTSIWIRENQKIKIRNIGANFCKEEENELVTELQEYFYTGKLPISPEDFPELEIVTRWVKRNRDGTRGNATLFVTITVGNMKNAEEIMGGIRNNINN